MKRNNCSANLRTERECDERLAQKGLLQFRWHMDGIPELRILFWPESPRYVDTLRFLL